MIVYTSIDKIIPDRRVVVLGNFDGLHKGHRQLITNARVLANELNAKLTVLTFHPQWQSIQNPDFKYLLPQNEKYTVLETLGADEVITLACDETFSKITANDFIEKILLETLSVCGVVVGFNYSFGFKASGTPVLLKEKMAPRGIAVHIEPPFEYENNIVSSSLIRKQIKAGNLLLANELLGYKYRLCGEVIHGAQNGRKMNFPTANIDYDTTLLLPAFGVYAAKAWLTRHPDISYNGVLNIGTRPTVDDSSKITIEIHLLDFNQDIYGEDLCIEISHFLRHISKFKNLDELKLTISNDAKNARKFFSKE